MLFRSLALAFRLAVSGIVLLRMVWALQHLITRGGLAYLLMLSLSVLAMCGAGFWWLEPSVHSFGDGLWLAFTTAATVGYGDIVPSTPGSRMFAVIVVLMGLGVLSVVTASVAALFVETEERQIERDLMREIGEVRRQLDALEQAVARLSHTRGP